MYKSVTSSNGAFSFSGFGRGMYTILRGGGWSSLDIATQQKVQLGRRIWIHTPSHRIDDHRRHHCQSYQHRAVADQLGAWHLQKIEMLYFAWDIQLTWRHDFNRSVIIFTR